MRTRTFPEIPYGVVVVALCIVAITPFALFRWGLGVLFPYIQDDLGTSRAELGLIASGLALGAGSTSLLAGWLVDLMGARRLESASLAGAAVGVVLFSQIQSPLHGVILGILMGATLSTLGPAYTKAIMDWVATRTRGLAIGIVEASIPLAGIIAAILISVLAVNFGWRTTVMVLAIAIAVSCAVFFTFYRDKPRSSADGQTRIRAARRVGLVARDHDMRVAAVSGAAFSGIQSSLVSYLVLFQREFLGLSSLVAGVGLAVALAGGAAGRLGWSLVSDLPLRGHRVATWALVGVACGLSLAAMTWLPSDAPLVVVLLMVFVLGGNGLGWSGVRAVFVAELAGPDLTGTAVGFASTISQMGAFVVPPLFGLIVDRTGSYDLAWWMAAGLASVGTLLLVFLTPQARRR